MAMAAKKKKPAKELSASMKWRARANQKMVWMTLSPEDHELAKDAARKLRLRSLAEFCREAVREATRKVLEG